MLSRVLHESAFRKADLKLSFSLGNKVTSLSRGFIPSEDLELQSFPLDVRLSPVATDDASYLAVTLLYEVPADLGVYHDSS